MYQRLFFLAPKTIFGKTTCEQVNEELQLAVRNNDVDGVKAAIEEGADVPLGPIWVTTWMASLEMVVQTP